ncbi:MAG TPA: ABC transporter permease [Candidatus Baltobacteraceae bacterium]|nr:ABC transporter permease [Candidatus Baltobacteraceae bacterium]
MKFLATLRIASIALLRNRSRSILTMLGVVIGVAAVIITVAIGAGARTSVANQINGLGSNMLIVLPGSINQGGARTGTGGASTLTPEDGLALAGLPHVAAVSPVVNVRAQVVAGSNNWQTTVGGVAPTYTYIRTWPMATGLFFSQSDVAAAAKVAVLGQTVVTNLFPDGSNPLGRTVLIRNVPFVVVGTLSAKGQSGVGQDQDDTILIPFTSALQRLTGQTTLSSMNVSADDPANIAAVQSTVTALLEQRDHIAAGGADDFAVRNLQDIANAASSTAAILQMLLAGVAAVSLVVGGIGIMNIMLVSVTERTREIGLRVAVGARRAAILWQFLVEAVLLSTAGGALGVAIGFVGSVAVAAIAKWPTAVSAGTVFLAVAFSALVGVFFGYYPAAKASRLNPIEALRFE